MHSDRETVEARVGKFVRERLEPAVRGRSVPVKVERWDVRGEPVPFAKAKRQLYLPSGPGRPWGAPWSTTWLRLSGKIPDGFGAADDVAAELVVDLGFNGDHPGFQAEGLAWRPDGSVVKAISPSSRYLPLADIATAGRFTVYIEAAANPGMDPTSGGAASGLGDPATAGRGTLYRLGGIALVERNVTVDALLADVRALAGLMHELPMDRPRRFAIVSALDRMLDAVSPDDVVGTAALGREALAGALASPANASAHTLVATGHAHIDTAWLWPIRETRRKCARTFSNVAALAEDNPDFVFSVSQAQQLAWVKDGYPELYARLQALAARGQFVPVGGMWVEPDTNMTGSEAMVRQFVEGKRFFRDEFGVDCEEVWLPDTFGYSGGLPQIAVAAGMRWFLTQKISWNQVNRMPHHTFWWEGIDGSRLFTHFPPVDTYNSDVSPRELAHAERNFADHGRASVSLLPFGYGDGGGGPTREMLASARRAANLEGSPRVVLGSARDFFERAESEYPDAPVWLGEMYLELHRGKLTSQANTKRGNRRCEHLLREAELWASTASVRVGRPYPADELKRCWRTVLMLQFHDILPGSSISWVYSDAEREHADVAGRLEAIIADSLAALAGKGRAAMIANAAPHGRDGVPAMGIGSPSAPSATSGEEVVDGYLLGNGLVSAVISREGLLVSLMDADSGRQAIAPGAAGNRLQLHHDIPNNWDAWDIDEFYRHTEVAMGAADVRLESAEGIPTVVVRRAFRASTVVQRITLGAGARDLTIRTEVDWHERQKLLKLGFGFDVRADTSASETLFGHVRRPTHTNTSWEAARFEFCAHRWLLVDEPGYGVAIANDATYGHEVTRAVRADGGTTTTVRLSLLRAPIYPDPAADQGLHEFTVTVRPNADAAGAVEQGYRANLAPRTLLGAGPVEPLFTVDNPGLVVEAVKLAEDGSGEVVVRLYEAHGRRTSGRLTPNFTCTETVCTDVLEDEIAVPSGVTIGEDAVELVLRPFQMVTLRFAR